MARPPQGRRRRIRSLKRGAKPSAAANGRVYRIRFKATDASGASCTGEVRVGAPMKQGGAAGDGGALYNSAGIS